ncbi:flagellar basal body rod protein FlgC [Algicella marina]|uniref:Flagellar basal body rod protein FlgC n=1 Tax=Algicella marina TaxID=2683284 RepID=A0A6P1T4M0_9RHOB|nr:flagellar basal body rod protein FlgC [Algicella marina]QHQ36446.1 flagellar basal body rod protein FlgC [Algicella marina]
MSDLLKSMTAASSGMAAQAARLRLSTENIANADTPGYRRKLVTFEVMEDAGDSRAVATGRTFLSRADLAQIYDPSHPLAGADGSYEGSNVNLMIELGDAREAQRSYEANMRMFDQARQMASSLLDLIRR